MPTPGLDPSRLHTLRSAVFGDGIVSLSLAPGVTVRSYAIGNRRVVDLFDPAVDEQVRIEPGMMRPFTVATIPVSNAGAVELTGDTIRPALVPPPEVSGDGDFSGNLPPTPSPVLDDSPGHATFAFQAGTGAAAFQKGTETLIVFDEARKIDPALLRGIAEFHRATVRLLPHAVVISATMPAGTVPKLTRSGVEWSIGVAQADAATSDEHPTADVRAEQGLIHWQAPYSGRVVVVPDPMTGEDLLVGTVTDTDSSVSFGRRFPQFTLLAAILGMVVDPLSDQVRMREVADGYMVDSGLADTGLALSAEADRQAPVQISTHSFDFPNQDAPILLRQLQTQIADAADAPVLSRLRYRRAVAQTMLALGLGPEAQSVLQIATADDPRALADDGVQALAAAAAVVAGRYDQADALSSYGVDETAEHKLWRGLRDAARLPLGAVPDPETVRSVASGVDVLLSYPPTLRRALVQRVADVLLLGGALHAADRLLASLPSEPDLAFARAQDLQAHGQNDTALSAYDQIAQQSDRLLRVRAAVAALGLRVQLGRMTAAKAADAGDGLLYAWRGDARERDLRLQVADWRGRAGQYRQQLEGLREALRVFPQPADGVQKRLVAAFNDIVSMPAGSGLDRLDPLELVSLVQGNMDLLPAPPEGSTILDRLADRLAALDLTPQAEAVVAKLLGGTTSPAIRAGLGARLAALYLGDGDGRSALDALRQPSGSDVTLPSALLAERSLLAARAHAQLGESASAIASLGEGNDSSVLLERARVYGQAHDWQRAAIQLSSYARQVIPSAGPLTASEAGVVLQLASALAQVGDEQGLAQLRARYNGRLTNGDDATLWSVLTESPVHGVGDLPRVVSEINSAAAVPHALQGVHHAN